MLKIDHVSKEFSKKSEDGKLISFLADNDISFRAHRHPFGVFL